MNFRKFFNDRLGAAARAMASKFSYGNYCGPSKPVVPPCDKHDDGSELLPAKDNLDSLCKTHDVDYCKCGADWTSGVVGSRGDKCTRVADSEFVQRIKQNLPLMSRRERLVAMMIANYFSVHGSLQRLLANDEPRNTSETE